MFPSPSLLSLSSNVLKEIIIENVVVNGLVVVVVVWGRGGGGGEGFKTSFMLSKSGTKLSFCICSSFFSFCLTSSSFFLLPPPPPPPSLLSPPSPPPPPPHTHHLLFLLRAHGGFRLSYSTSDSIVVLEWIVQKYFGRAGGRFYTLYVDFYMAFQWVDGEKSCGV